LIYGIGLKYERHKLKSLNGVFALFYYSKDLNIIVRLKVKLKVALRVLFSTAALEADCTLAPDIVPSFISRGAITPSGTRGLY
jgi:hypothetical protein